ncbi:MAG: YbfB/YjiJ family MFS transporter [Beijerinckiaceae bacterium]
MLLAAVMGIGRFVYTPLLPHMAEAVPLTPSAAGWIASANYLGYLAGALAATALPAPAAPRRVIAFGLILSAVTTGLMAAASSLVAFATLRFLGGIASALVLLYMAPIIFARLAEVGGERYVALLFGGVGVGIAVSALLVSSLSAAGFSWRTLWLASGVVTALALFALPNIPSGRGAPASSGAGGLVWSRRLAALAVSYTLFGFGYVITATFLVVIVRESSVLRPLEPLIWALVGLAGIPSVWAWNGLAGRIGIFRAYAVACLAEAVGVTASVVSTNLAAPILAAVLLGGTFMALTALGLAGARRIPGSNPARVLALLTAGFGFGQIVGPLLAGYLREAAGTYLVPSLAAAAALSAAAALAAPLDQKR